MKVCGAILMICAFSIASFAQKSETMTIKLYFTDSRNNPGMEDCAKVRAVTRTIPKTTAVAKAALEELFKGTTKTEESDELSSVFSDATKDILISIKIKKGAAYINLKKDVIQKLGDATTSCGGLNYSASIEKTLKQFPIIKKIFYAIEGNPSDYYDWMQADGCPKELKNCSGKDF